MSGSAEECWLILKDLLLILKEKFVPVKPRSCKQASKSGCLIEPSKVLEARSLLKIQGQEPSGSKNCKYQGKLKKAQ